MDVSKAWYVSVSLRPKLSPAWIMQLKKILVMACRELRLLKVRSELAVMEGIGILLFLLQFGLPSVDVVIKLYMELVS